MEGLSNVERSRSRGIPHGVRVRAGSDEIAREQMILFVGAIQKRKNVRRLIEAFASTPSNWKLVLAGSLGYGSEEELQAVGQITLRPAITITGDVGDDDLDRLYGRASYSAFA